MGGNAISSPAMRMTTKQKEKYELLFKRFVSDAMRHSAEIRPSSIILEPFRSYSEKETHGDIDILLYGREEVLQCVLDSVGKLVSFTAEDGIGMELVEVVHTKNSNVYSIGARVDIDEEKQAMIQIDLMFLDSEKYDMGVLSMHNLYFNYNDMGNLLGRIAASVGFKLSPYGLFYKDKQHGDVLVTTNLYETLEFLGYGYRPMFKTLESIFEYVASSPLFRPDIFLLENRNAKARTRDSKRPTYTAFLEWCEKNKHRFPSDLPDSHCSMEREDYGFSRACELFDGFEGRVDAVYQAAEKAQAEKKFYGGTKIMGATGLEGGPELGKFIAALKEKYRGTAIHTAIPDSLYNRWVNDEFIAYNHR